MRRSYEKTGNEFKAISIRQPFAEAIVLGHKTVENRSWPTNYRGPLLIHAGAKLYPRRHLEADEVRRLALRQFGLWDNGRVFERGALIGVVELYDCVPFSAVASDRWAVGPWCWRLRNARRFETPIPWKGSLSLFGVERSLVDEAVFSVG